MRRNWFSVFILNIAFAVLVYLPVRLILFLKRVTWEKLMNFTKTIMTTASAALISSAAFAGSHMSMEMTIVSWGGAYSASQLKAYHEPYSAKTGVTILNDDSSSTAVAQLTMNEANNITWDVVDVEAAPAMQLCDEGETD